MRIILGLIICLSVFAQVRIPGPGGNVLGGGGGSITQVQLQTGNTFPAASITLTFGSSTTSGNTIIIKIVDYYNSSDPSAKLPWSIADTHTGCASPCNTWVTDYGPASNAGAQGTGAIYRASNISGGTSHAITITFTGGTTYTVAEVGEYTCGTNHCAPDGAALDFGVAVSGSSPFGWSIGPSNSAAVSNDLVLGFSHQLAFSNTYTVTAPFGLDNTVTDGGAHEMVTWHQIATSSGTFTAAGTTTGNTSVYGVIAAYKP